VGTAWKLRVAALCRGMMGGRRHLLPAASLQRAVKVARSRLDEFPNVAVQVFNGEPGLEMLLQPVDTALLHNHSQPHV
jgi:hypothetical protein